MNNSTIKPCPCCGYGATQMRDMTNGKYYVVCDACLLRQDGYILKEDSIKAWNTRHE